MDRVCGRYVSAGDLADLAVLLGANPFAPDAPAGDAPLRRDRHEQRRFGLAPTDPVPAIVPGPEPGARQLDLLTWGLVPAWADPATGARRINARVETVLEKASFRRAARSRRALLPADGWYEWIRSPDGRRVPHLVRPADGGLLTFAGLYERWYPPAGADAEPLVTCTILTGPAPDPLTWLHERAPLVVPPELHEAWLDPDSAAGADAEALLAALRTAGDRPMLVSQVSPAVNHVRNTGAQLTEPVEADLPGVGTPSAQASPAKVAAEQAALW
jgi:putative SOS response-associated peptidase YedK